MRRQPLTSSVRTQAKDMTESGIGSSEIGSQARNALPVKIGCATGSEPSVACDVTCTE